VRESSVIVKKLFDSERVERKRRCDRCCSFGAHLRAVKEGDTLKRAIRQGFLHEAHTERETESSSPVSRRSRDLDLK